MGHSVSNIRKHIKRNFHLTINLGFQAFVVSLLFHVLVLIKIYQFVDIITPDVTTYNDKPDSRNQGFYSGIANSANRI